MQEAVTQEAVTQELRRKKNNFCGARRPWTLAAGNRAAGNGSNDEKRFRARSDRRRQSRIRRFVGHILGAREEAQKRPAFPGDVIADSALQHRIARFECVEDRALGDRTLDGKLHVATDAGERPQVRGKYHLDCGHLGHSNLVIAT